MDSRIHFNKVSVLLLVLIVLSNLLSVTYSININRNNKQHHLDINNDIDNEVESSDLLDRIGSNTGGIIPFIEHKITCELCTWAIHTVQDMVASKKKQEDIEKFLIDTCIVFKIEKPSVCEGIIPLYGNETFDVIGDHENKPEYICGFVGICPFVPANFTGIVTFPKPKPPHVTPVPPAKGGKTFSILHLSDVHVDTLYVPGMNNDCGEPLCCRAVNGEGQGDKAAGYWGDYNCDVNMQTVNSMFEHIASTHTPDFIFWTGDNPPHDIWEQSHGTQLNASSRITNLFLKYFPGVPVFPSIGNHEGVPVNSFPLPGMQNPSSSWLFTGLSQDWQDWLQNDAEAISTLQYGGYYTLPLQNGNAQDKINSRVISLNMNWCNDQNLWLVENATDAAGMITWLINTLQASEDIQEKVYIIGHIPPGIDDCIDVWSQQFYQVVDRYEDTIVAMFFGHTHRDEFQILHTSDGTNRPTAIAYVTPSTTTYQNQNPSYRIYTADWDSTYLVEVSTYHTNLTLANLNGQDTQPIWELEYNATTAYNGQLSQDLFPTSWQSLVDNMESDRSLFEEYFTHYYSSSPYGVSEASQCKGSCFIDMWCTLTSGYYYQYKACVANATSHSLISLHDHYEYVGSIPKTC